MKINLATSAGFCFGVRRAINIAMDTARNNKPVFMLGDIVHNEEVVRQIQKAGIKKIYRLTAGRRERILLIRAHGCSRDTLQKAKKLGYSVIDATCPMVKEIHAIAKKLENKGFKIIVIGDKSHDEVKGIVGQLKTKAVVIDKPENIPLKKISSIGKAGVVLQSTQNLEKVQKIFDILRANIGKVRFHNTICKPTRAKQNEIKVLPLKNEVVIVIGSKSSANTKRIYEISKSLNDKSYWVNSSREIKRSWLDTVKNVGITAGASTPESTIREVIRKIKSYSCA
ncbi:MAG: 4-hydroxy-3-methylbut-2-enyl diphosphate reductase [Candidatus Omnitrophica bacterium]|nr:4-hydroxy-3-methylbut-2-enyl diphosphate reductase [Candidatus Omnitrophota bacterium]